MRIVREAKALSLKFKCERYIAFAIENGKNQTAVRWWARFALPTLRLLKTRMIKGVREAKALSLKFKCEEYNDDAL